MKKAKRILALLLAFVMAASFMSTTAFAKTSANDYTDYRTNPDEHFNSVNKLKVNANEGAGYVLDLLDNMLYEANIDLDGYYVANETAYSVKLTIKMGSVDQLLYTIWNLIDGLHSGDDDEIGNVMSIKVIGIGMTGLATKLVDWGIAGDDITDLTADSIGDQNAVSRVARKVGNASDISSYNASNDLTVLYNIIGFLGDNASKLSELATGDFDLGTLGDLLEDTKVINNVTIGNLLSDLPGALKDILYPMLFDSNAEEAPDGFTWDTYVQKLVNWLLIDGTGEDSSNGGTSVLGADFDAFLPAMADFGQGADLYNQSFYQLINNAINGLLSGMVSDLLENLLLDLLDVDTSVNEGKGDPEILSNTVYVLVIGLVKSLCEANGAPELTFTGDAAEYPVPQIEALLDWFFVGGGLSTFVHIGVDGIGLTDNFISLLNDVLRLVPSLMPVLGISVPDSIAYPDGALTETVSDDTHGDLYLTFEGEEIYIPDEENPDYYEYVSDDTAVNTTDSSAGDYRNPKFIRAEYAVSVNEVWGYILKILLNSLIDGCYFPEWATDVPTVGAYGLASLAACYLPSNNYFDRLDAYHAQEIGESYTARGTLSVTPLAYTEDILLSDNTTVTVPRAAMDIGASLGAYFLNGAFDFQSDSGKMFPETDTNFETYLYEFLTWGMQTYAPILCGKYDSSTHTYSSYGTYVTAAWLETLNTAESRYQAELAARPRTTVNGAGVCNTDTDVMRSIDAYLLNNTVFKIFPTSWLPDEYESAGAEALIYEWLLDSINKFDLQQLLSILSANSDGELTLPTMTVLVRIIDRVLGTVFGGNAVLPTAVPNNSGTNRIVYNTNTSITTLEGLLGSGSALGTFIKCLLYYLDDYKQPLAETIFPFFASDDIKSYAYNENGTAVNYIGSNTVTVDELEDYVKYFEDDANSSVYTDTEIFSSAAKAETVASDIGLTDYKAEDNIVTDGGVEKYGVTFPASYEHLADAENAANYASDYTGNTCSVNSERTRENGVTTVTYTVLEEVDYIAGTSTCTTTYQDDDGDGRNDQTIYTFSDFDYAKIITDSNGSTRTGSKGEVQYESGYRSREREDFQSYNIKYINRLNNACEDASDFVSDYNTFAESTLPSAYGDWLMYFIQMKAIAAGVYDRNGDGSVDVNDYPSAPSSVYPYGGNSTVSKYTYSDGTTSYNLASIADTSVVKLALDYAKNSENDVVLNNVDAEVVLKLALGTSNVDVTPDADGNYTSGAIGWSDIAASSDDTSKVNTLCNAIGLTYEAANNQIKRKAFALFNGTFNGAAALTTSYTYTYTESSGSDKTLSGQTISIVPSGSIDRARSRNEIQNDIINAAIDFAEDVTDMETGLKDHYDDISWRASTCSTTMVGVAAAPTLNTLSWTLKYTYNGYYPAGSQNGRNKVRSKTGALTQAYSTSSYDKFQKAYDYAQQLYNYCAQSNGMISQSVISKAYQGLIKAYGELEEYTGAADWTQLLKYISQAETILSGPLGLTDEGTQADAVNGYTLETLTALKDELEQATTMYTNHSVDYDQDSQDLVDDEAIDLNTAIQHLAFGDGIDPDIIINANYKAENTDATIDITTFEGDLRTSRQAGIILGLEEGVGMTQELVTDALVATGFTTDGNSNTIELSESGYGAGTGSYVDGKTSYTTQVRYYVVLIGDLNGDTRIDNNDKVIIDLYQSNILTEDMPQYLKVAADVNMDGSLDAADLNMIKSHFMHRTVNGVTDEISQTASVADSWVKGDTTNS